MGAAAGPAPSFAIRNARIFDGERIIPSGTVVVRGDRIAFVGEEVDLSDVGEIIDARGQTLLPGLIDAHFHADEPEAYRGALAFGVTTVVDMFGQASAFLTKTSLGALPLRGADEADALIGLLITSPGGHGTEFGNIPMPTAATPQECQQAVNSQLDAGASFVKLVYDAGESWSSKAVPTLSRDVLASCIEAAHARSVRVVVHAWTLRESREVLKAGADGLAHGIADTVIDPAFAEWVASRGAFVIPTVAVLSGIVGQRNDQLILSDSRLAPYLLPSGLRGLQAPFPDGFGQGMKLAVLQENIRLLKAARVPILAGSDCANPRTAVGATLHQELELLVGSGLTIQEALMAATSLPAASFRLSDRGRIASGLRADLLLVQGDPTTDIRMTRNIVAVWKQGKKLDREAFRVRIEAARQANTQP